ncbi:MAG: acyltransferase family protein [Nakamurella sp.]
MTPFGRDGCLDVTTHSPRVESGMLAGRPTIMVGRRYEREKREVGYAVGASGENAQLTAPQIPAQRPKQWIGGLDGLRAIAVVAVVLFHLNPGYLSGGFLGVDLFFVISGYLITRLLLAERLRSGRIGLGQFYLRRIRRLLPAVVALLAVASTIGYAAWPDQRPTLPDSALSSLGYLTNWWLIADKQSYFASMGRPPMLQHLWSLAIEEQYYLLWAPIVIVLGAAWMSRRRSAPPWHVAALVAAVAGTLALASTAVMTTIAIATNIPYQADSSRVYFGTDTHSMGLLLGSALGALATIPWRTVTRRPPRWVRPAWRDTWPARPLLPAWIIGDATRRPLGRWSTDLFAIVGIGGVAWFFVSIDEYVPWLYRGGFLAFSAVSAVAICCAARAGSLIGRLLDTTPLAWIGRRSYGIYLWHWPVFVVTRPLIDVQGPQWLIDCARTGLAIAIAAASYRYLETPVRAGTFIPSLRQAWSNRKARSADWRTGQPTKYDGGRRTVPRRVAHQWILLSVAAGCVAVLVSAHMATVQQPVWAASMPGTALPIPGVVPDLPGGIDGSVSPPSLTSTKPASGTLATHVVTSPPTATTTAAAAATSAPAVASTPAPTALPTSPAHTPTTQPTAPASPPATGSASPPASSVKVSAFGDSVLLGASHAVRAVVGSLSLDAVVGRQAWDTLDDVAAAQKAGKLAPVVLIHTGNNGVISPQQLTSTLAALKDHTKVVLVNDHVDRPWQGPNNKIFAAVNGHYPNVVILDWNSVASKNPGWFGPDGIHVNGAGAKAYANLVAKVLK